MPKYSFLPKSALLFALLAPTVQLQAQTCTFNAQIGDYFEVAKLSGGQALMYTHIEDGGVVAPDTLKKVNALGQTQWTQILPQGMRLAAVDAAPDTGFYACGYCYKNLTYGGYNFQANYSGAWLARYDKSGNVVWARGARGKGYSWAFGISATANKVVITGAFQDSLNFMGQVFQATPNQQLFVASISSGGSLQAINVSAGSSTVVGSQSFNSSAQGLECRIDAAGNVYVLTWAYGRTMVDTFQIGLWDSYNEYGPYRKTILKLNAALQPLRKTVLNDCVYYCQSFANLRVTAAGECYVVESGGYAQSGNDELYSKIHKLNPNGLAVGTFTLPEAKNGITGIDLDECENLYYTGFTRDYIYSSSPVCYTVIVGRLSTFLTPVWAYQTVSCTDQLFARSIAAIGNNKTIVTGVYSDVIILKDTLTGKNDYFNNYLAGINGNGGEPCTNAPAAIRSFDPDVNVSLYPNPANSILYVNSVSGVQGLCLSNISGQIVFSGNTKEIDISNLPEGLYFAEIRTDEGRVATKVLVQR